MPVRVEPVGDLLAFDPGADHPAVALFRCGVLRSSERLRPDASWAQLCVLDRSIRIATAAIRWAMALDADPVALVVEHPQVYRGGKSKGDPADLLLLATINGALGGVLSYAVAPRDRALVVLSPTPGEWAGQLPKATKGDPWKSPRAALVRDRLSPAELEVVQSTHDAIDACGLGLWALGRFDVRRVLPGVVEDDGTLPD